MEIRPSLRACSISYIALFCVELGYVRLGQLGASLDIAATVAATEVRLGLLTTEREERVSAGLKFLLG